jgi:hypothetical protein
MSEYQWNLIYLKALGSCEVLTGGTKAGTMFQDVMPCSLIVIFTRLHSITSRKIVVFSWVLPFFRGQVKITMDKDVGWTY